MAITKLNSLAIPDDTIVEADLSYPLTGFSSTGIEDNATSTAITIDSLGRTQIGTTSAYNSYADNLVVEDDSNCGITIATTDTTARTSLYFADGAVVGADQYRGIIEYRHSSNSMHFWTDATDHGIVINSSGDLGIGITSLVNPLHVGVTSNTASKTSGSAFDGGALRLDGGLGSADSEVAILGGSNDGLSSGIGFARQDSSTWATQIRFYTHGTGITTTDELTERMRLDGSGNLLVGTTNANPTSAGVNDAGVELSNTGGVRSTVASNPAATFNRKTDDGYIALFRKDGNTIGSIGNHTNKLEITGSGSNTVTFGHAQSTTVGAGIYSWHTNNSVLPYNSAGHSIPDGVQSLGHGSYRWKDLFLSGGAYLGGTASGNYLDDYEEGTWTPVIGGSTGTSGQSYTTQVGHYTKIGRQVIVTFLVDLSNKGTITGDCVLSGLPFACLNNNGSGAGVISYFDNLTANVSSMSLNGNQNNASAYINHVVGSGATATVNTTAIIGTSTRLDGVFSYFTSA